jgi:hypothetical protein
VVCVGLAHDLFFIYRQPLIISAEDPNPKDRQGELLNNKATKLLVMENAKDTNDAIPPIRDDI